MKDWNPSTQRVVNRLLLFGYINVIVIYAAALRLRLVEMGRVAAEKNGGISDLCRTYCVCMLRLYCLFNVTHS
jgi:hypothetical protein